MLSAMPGVVTGNLHNVLYVSSLIRPYSNTSVTAGGRVVKIYTINIYVHVHLYT